MRKEKPGAFILEIQESEMIKVPTNQAFLGVKFTIHIFRNNIRSYQKNQCKGSNSIELLHLSKFRKV